MAGDVRRELKQRTGRAPHNYVLLQRIERAKQKLRDPKRSIIKAGLESRFQNPNHFARMFRKLEGTTLQSSERILYRGRPLRNFLMVSNTTAKCIYRVARRFGSKPPCDNSRIAGHSEGFSNRLKAWASIIIRESAPQLATLL
jgi:hypothetical protein